MNAQTPIDERHAIGANGPPDAYEAHATHIDDLYLEAGNWCDGAEIENEAQAAEVDRLIQEFKDAIEAAEASRDEEKKPHADKVTAIQERYYPLIGDTKKVTGKAIRAKKALLEVKTVWGRKVAESQKIEAERLRAEAVEAARVASEAAVAARGDLQASEQAEALIKTAQATLKAATQAEKPAVKGMRDNWVVKGFAEAVEGEDGQVMKGSAACLRHYLRTRPEAILEALLDLARVDVRNGIRTIPGVVVENDRKAF